MPCHQRTQFTWSRHHRRVDQRLIWGNFGLEPPPAHDAAARQPPRRAPAGQRRNSENGCRRLVQPDPGDCHGAAKPRGPACVSGAVAAVTRTPPAHRYRAPARGSGRRGAAAPRAGRLRGRRAHGFAAPASDQVTTPSRLPSSIPARAIQFRRHDSAIPGPSRSGRSAAPAAGPAQRHGGRTPVASGPALRTSLRRPSSPQIGCPAKRGTCAGLTHFWGRSARPPELPGRTDAPAR